MLEEIIRELDEKVEFLINRNAQYRREIENLRGLLDEANSRNFAPQGRDLPAINELKPLAESILSRLTQTRED